MVNQLNEYIWSMCIEDKKIRELEKELEEQEKSIVKMQEKVSPQTYAFYIEKEELCKKINLLEKDIELLKKDDETKTKVLNLEEEKQQLNNNLKKLLSDNKETDKFCKVNEDIMKQYKKLSDKYDSLNESYIEKMSSFEDLICCFKKDFDINGETKAIEDFEKDGKNIGVHWMYGPVLLEETKGDCLIYRVLFPEYISKFVSEEDRSVVMKKFPLESVGISLFALGNPIKHFSYLYSENN